MKKYAKEFVWVLLTAWIICLPIGLSVSGANEAPFWYKFLQTLIVSLGGAIIPIGIGFVFLAARKNRPYKRLKTAIIITAVISLWACIGAVR